MGVNDVPVAIDVPPTAVVNQLTLVLATVVTCKAGKALPSQVVKLAATAVGAAGATQLQLITVTTQV